MRKHMECREQRLTWEAALGLYQQLREAEREHLLDDGLPNIVESASTAEDGSAAESFQVEDRAAQAFLRQFRGDPMRSFFSLQLDGCPPDRFHQLAAQWAQAPTSQRFLHMLAQIDGPVPRTPVEYLAAAEFNADELDQLRRIATVVGRLNPTVAEEDLRYFCHAVRHALALGCLADGATALEALTRTSFHIRISGVNNQIRTAPGTVRDLACQILSLVALADLEHTLQQQIPADQYRNLPAPIVHLRRMRTALLTGAVRSHYNPTEIATEAGTLARHDMATNTIEYGAHCDAATFLSQRLDGLGVRYPAQVALHELTHAAQDRHQGVFAPNQPIMFWHHDEAEATFAEMFYVWLKDGPGIAANFAPPNDTNVRINDYFVTQLQRYLGVTLSQDLPSTNYRGLAVQLVGDYLGQMAAGGVLTGVDLHEVADRHANAQATNDLLQMVARENMVPLLKLAAQAQARTPLDQPILMTQSTADRSAILYYHMTMQLPGQLPQWGTIVEKNIRLLESYFVRMKDAQSPALYAKLQYAIWSGGLKALIQSMLEYAVYRHACDPKFDVKQFVATRLFPLATRRYLMPQNPAHLGIEIPPAP